MQLSNPHRAFFFPPLFSNAVFGFLGLLQVRKTAKCLLFLSKYIKLGSQLVSDKLPACVVVAVRHFCSIRAQWKTD